MGVDISVVCFGYTGISKQDKEAELDNISLVDGYETVEFYSCNITHNISQMWRESGCYDVIYSDSPVPVEEAIPVLEKAVDYFTKNKKSLERLNSKNGWGLYEDAYIFISKLLAECKKRPKTILIINK